MVLTGKESKVITDLALAIKVEAREINGYGMVNVEILTENGVEYVRHPLSACWPALEPADFIELVESVDSEGLLNMPVMYQGCVLDGWQRVKALWTLGKIGDNFPLFSELPEGGDPVALVAGVNGFRRHISGILKAIALHETCQLAGVLAKRGGQEKGNKRVTVKELADRCGVGQRTMGRIRKLAEESPELLEQVRADQVSLRAALIEAGIEKDTPAPAPAPVEEYQDAEEDTTPAAETEEATESTESTGDTEGQQEGAEFTPAAETEESTAQAEPGATETEEDVTPAAETEEATPSIVETPEGTYAADPEDGEPVGLTPSYEFAKAAVGEIQTALDHLVESITDIFNVTPAGGALDLLREARRKANSLSDMVDDVHSDILQAEGFDKAS